MTPLDDSLRDALKRAASQAPSASHVDAASVSAAAGRLRQRRTTYALGSSMLVVAAIAVGVATIPGSGTSRVPTAGGTGISESASPSGVPTPTPTLGLGSAVSGWSFRGDESIWTKDRDQATQAYTSYRQLIGDPLDASPASELSVRALYAGPIVTGSGDVLAVQVLQTDRADRVAVISITPGGVRVLTDQPASADTTMVQALVPSDPANIIFAMMAPGDSQQFYYQVQQSASGGTDVTPETTADGIAQFGRSLDSKGGIEDWVAIGSRMSTNPYSTQPIPPLLDQQDVALFGVDQSQAGRLSSEYSVVQWELAAWGAGDRTTALIHGDKAFVDAMFAQSYPAGATNGTCQRTSPIGENVISQCQIRIAGTGAIPYYFQVGGGASLGFTASQFVVPK